MYVLGEMIQLAPSRNNPRYGKERYYGPQPLPLPWYQRAPLGFLSDTPVFVAIQANPQEIKPEDIDSAMTAKFTPPGEVPISRKKDGKMPLGDLVVSVIDPTRTILNISTRLKERPGILSDVFKELQGLFLDKNINVALAEAVTTECRQFHHINLVTELLLDTKKSDAESIQKAIYKMLEKLKKTAKQK